MSNIAKQVSALCANVQALSMIGAALKLQADAGGDPAIREQITKGAEAALKLGPGELQDPDAQVLVERIGMALVEAQELFTSPTRPGGWKMDNPILMQRQGQASGFAFRNIVKLSQDRPQLAAALEGRFLDIGTGVGGIAMEAARSCPKLTVDGIDIWEPALELAIKNVQASPYADRVNIENRNVTNLEGDRRYTLVWLPTMFLNEATLQSAMKGIVSTSLPGAYIVAAIYTEPQDPVAGSFAKLRTLRSGGELTKPEQVERLFRDHGYDNIEVSAGPLASFVLGRLAK